MSSLPCDVVILPNPLLAERAITASNKLSKFDSLFTLKMGDCYPHASVYMLQLKTESLDEVKRLLKTIVQSYSPPQLEAQLFDHTNGYIDVEYKKTPELVSLQADIVKLLNPIRDGMRAKDEVRMKEATGAKKESYQKYGWGSVGELYRPHMTLSRIESDNLGALEVLGEPSQFSGAFLKLGLFEMGDNGTAKRKIFELDFSGTTSSH